MQSILNLSSSQLRQAADIRARIEELTNRLEVLLSQGASAGTGAKKEGGMSAEGRARIAEAQRARGAKFRAKNPQQKPNPPKRTTTPEQKAKIAAAARKRWVRPRLLGKTACDFPGSVSSPGSAN